MPISLEEQPLEQPGEVPNVVFFTGRRGGMGFDRGFDPWLDQEEASSQVTNCAEKLTRNVSVLEDVKWTSPSVGGPKKLEFPPR
jgi:hypothetical protein